MHQLPIERVPLPPAARGRISPYPWKTMGVGDSFFAPGRDSLPTSNWGLALGNGAKFTTRSVTEHGVSGSRCWRVA
jgi:hypothetical protein